MVSVVDDRPRNGRQVIRLINRPRKDQHEPLQVGAGHLIYSYGSQSDLYVVMARIEFIYIIQ
jgi:hypothetical protein